MTVAKKTDKLAALYEPQIHKYYINTLFFFYKNIFYKNIEAKICEILRIF